MDAKLDKIEYKLKKSIRSKNIRISVSYGAGVLVTAPQFVSNKTIDDFVGKNAVWIREKMHNFLKLKDKKIIKTGRRDYLKNKEIARRIISQRVEYYNKYYNFKFNRISIKNQKTLWGSCSGDGNLNFNYALIKLSKEMLDYVIVHEMCHLWEFNHSKEFWRLVGLTIPNCKKIKKEMKDYCFV